MTELEKEINNLRSGLKSVESVSAAWFLFVLKLKRKSCTQFLSLMQELEFQTNRPQVYGDKFVSVVSQFITVASFSFSDVEDSLSEAKELVSVC